MVIKFIGRYKLSEKIVLLSNKDLANFEKLQAVSKLDKTETLSSRGIRLDITQFVESIIEPRID